MRAFNTLASLNAVLASVGLPELTSEMIARSIASGENAIELDFADAPNRDEIQAALEAMFGGKGEPASEGEQVDLSAFVGGEDESEQNYVSQSKFESYIEMSCDQIALLTRQRDEARASAESEIKDHLECHEHFEQQLHEMRIYGHMESTAAGLFNKPYEQLPADTQVAIRRQAETTVANLDSLRAGPQG